jgi:hypothetical protein
MRSISACVAVGKSPCEANIVSRSGLSGPCPASASSVFARSGSCLSGDTEE